MGAGGDVGGAAGAGEEELGLGWVVGGGREEGKRLLGRIEVHLIAVATYASDTGKLTLPKQGAISSKPGHGRSPLVKTQDT